MSSGSDFEHLSKTADDLKSGSLKASNAIEVYLTIVFRTSRLLPKGPGREPLKPLGAFFVQP